MEGKKILLGVCGGIAAYKIASLIRLLVKSGCEVKVIMTPAAADFIPPLTLSTLSKHPIAIDFVKNQQGEWQNHVELGLWADLMVIAPATANTLAKMANGLCDNLLLATYLSAKCPVMLAPAMDLDMYKHPSTSRNLDQVKKFGNYIINPAYGELASGLVGEGRMAEPETILIEIEDYFYQSKRFTGKKVLITAGPTHEKIDPVRFIGNSSSGKMGLCLAECFANEGAEVILVSGPGVDQIAAGNVVQVNVVSADDMYRESERVYREMDIAIFAAAVADYRPAIVAQDKIKKTDANLQIELVKNKDIAYELGLLKRSGQINIGFALETEHEEEYALGKLKKKNFDLIVLNSLNDKGAGFAHDTNKITIFSADQTMKRYSLKSKKQVAQDIVDAIYEL